MHDQICFTAWHSCQSMYMWIYVGCMKKYVENMKKYEGIRRKYEEIPLCHSWLISMMVPPVPLIVSPALVISSCLWLLWSCPLSCNFSASGLCQHFDSRRSSLLSNRYNLCWDLRKIVFSLHRNSSLLLVILLSPWCTGTSFCSSS